MPMPVEPQVAAHLMRRPPLSRKGRGSQAAAALPSPFAIPPSSALFRPPPSFSPPIVILSEAKNLLRHRNSETLR